MFPVGGGGGGGGAFDFSGESQPISGGRVDNGGFTFAPKSGALSSLPPIAWLAIAIIGGVIAWRVLR